MTIISKVRAGSLSGFAAEVTALGGDPVALLRSVDLDPAMLHDPERLMDLGQIVILLNTSARVLVCPDFGLRVAQHVNVAALGTLGALVMAAPDLKSGFEVLERHVNLHHTTEQWRLSVHDGLGYIRRLEHSTRPSGFQHYHELALAGFLRVAAQIGGPMVRPVRVEFSHSRVAPLEQYRRHLGCDAVFNEEHDCIVFDISLLGLPNSHADRRPERPGAAVSQPGKPNLELEVRGAIAQGLGERTHGLAEVARLIGLGPRTLQRRLAAEGLSFQELVQEVRHNLACWHLEASAVDITRLSDLLGYADLPTFSKRFKARAGSSPAEWRRAARGSA